MRILRSYSSIGLGASIWFHACSLGNSTTPRCSNLRPHCPEGQRCRAPLPHPAASAVVAIARRQSHPAGRAALRHNPTFMSFAEMSVFHTQYIHGRTMKLRRPYAKTPCSVSAKRISVADVVAHRRNGEPGSTPMWGLARTAARRPPPFGCRCSAARTFCWRV